MNENMKRPAEGDPTPMPPNKKNKAFVMAPSPGHGPAAMDAITAAGFTTDATPMAGAAGVFFAFFACPP